MSIGQAVKVYPRYRVTSVVPDMIPEWFVVHFEWDLPQREHKTGYYITHHKGKERILAVDELDAFKKFDELYNEKEV